MSQGNLAASLGVTFQQIQKYERRHEPSRGKPVAKCGDCPRDAGFLFVLEIGRRSNLRFFAGLKREFLAFLETNEGRDLKLAFNKISSHLVRTRFVDHVRTIAAVMLK